MPPKKKQPENYPDPVCNHAQRDGVLGQFLPDFPKGRIDTCPQCGDRVIAAPRGFWSKGITIKSAADWMLLEPEAAPVGCRDPVVTYYRGHWHRGHHVWGGFDSCRHRHHTCPPDDAPGGFSHAPTLF